MSKTIDQHEIAKFTKIADEWWNPKGKFKPLHQINPVRLNYIRQIIQQRLKIAKNSPEQALQNIKILDVGCGGGLVSVPLARLGAKVHGIDAGFENVKVAEASAEKFGLEIDFAHYAIEDMPPQEFDVVVALEIIEHVADVAVFMQHLAKNIRHGGLLILSTINRTLQSYLKAIIAAEYILRMLPIGTHEFNKFLRPSEITAHFSVNDLQLLQMNGLTLNVLKWQWEITDDINVNYLMVIEKL